MKPESPASADPKTADADPKTAADTMAADADPAATCADPDAASILLAEAELPLPGLYRRHPERNLSAVAAAITGAYRGAGPVRLGADRTLVVIAVDGLGYPHAARTLTPDALSPLTERVPDHHGRMPAHLGDERARRNARFHRSPSTLHADGRQTVNCHDGQTASPNSPVPIRPTRTPRRSPPSWMTWPVPGCRP